ncbi:MAG TPA: histidine phosphatase family protein [Thermomicrobiales bacterium]|jgi:probable phosphoglycerate mutase
MRLVLVRHGESEANAAGIYQGWLDSPLSSPGERQVAATARALAARDDLRPVAVYASPLLRAWRTGEVIAAALGLTAVPHPGLREINVGAATSLTFAAVGERWPQLATERASLGLDHGWPEGETGRTFGARVASTLGEIIARHQRPTTPGDREEAVILASHGGTIRFALAYLRGDVANRWPDDPVRNCSLAEIALAPTGHRIISLDQCDHLFRGAE